MPSIKLIADSGATKTEWCLVNNNEKKTIFTQGISPYFLNADQILAVLQNELLPFVEMDNVQAVFYYGTGCTNMANAAIIKNVLSQLFVRADNIEVTHDVMAAARGLYGTDKGVACILGTGAGACYYDGHAITTYKPGLGYVLGDEGSGAYLGKKILQYFFYEMFDKELNERFETKFNISRDTMLEHVYKKPMANRYLASFTPFLSETRGHEITEEIIRDAFHNFFSRQIMRIKESQTEKISFVGSIAYHFQDVLQTSCNQFNLSMGSVLKNPMEGLSQYH